MIKDKARLVISYLVKYNTNFYTCFDPVNPSNNVEIVDGVFVSFAKYDQYHFFVDDFLTEISNIPTSAVKLNDLIIFKVIFFKKAKYLNKRWSAEFDRASIIRATRTSMRIAVKIWINAKEEDVKSKIISAKQAEWYYLWWRGLHMLCGKEGQNAGIYKIKLNFETVVIDDFC